MRKYIYIIIYLVALRFIFIYIFVSNQKRKITNWKLNNGRSLKSIGPLFFLMEGGCGGLYLT